MDTFDFSRDMGEEEEDFESAALLVYFSLIVLHVILSYICYFNSILMATS